MEKILDNLSFDDKLKYLSKQFENDALFITPKTWTPADQMEYFKDWADTFNSMAEKINNTFVFSKDKVHNLLFELSHGYKVASIKMLREIYSDIDINVGLKEAKDEVERVYDFNENAWNVSRWSFKGYDITMDTYNHGG